MLFTSNINGNKLFFPFGGDIDDTQLNNFGTRGYIWTTKFVSRFYAYVFRYDNSELSDNYYSARRYGFSVRAVANPSESTRAIRSVEIQNIPQSQLSDIDKEDNTAQDLNEPLDNYETK